jgi:hypothetical protein
MNDIKLPMTLLNDVGLTINEYLILYNLANNHCISEEFSYTLDQLVALEQKGFIKLTSEGVFIRDKAEVLFSVKRDLFEEWLLAYPTNVKKKFGGSRALSPSKVDTMLGKRLRKKWSSIFKKNIEAEEKAIKVLQLQVKQMEQSGDLEYMVEAARWLNEGYHEKYEYLLDEQAARGSRYEDEDYL